jgi:hypothetical protein
MQTYLIDVLATGAAGANKVALQRGHWDILELERTCPLLDFTKVG